MSLVDEMRADPWLTKAEVAAMFGVEPVTVGRWIRQGLLPSVRTPGNYRRFRRSVVEALLKQSP